MSQSGRMTTSALDYATQAPGRLAGIQTSSGLVHRPGQGSTGILRRQGSTGILRRPGQGGTGIWRQPIQNRAILSGVGTPAYLQEADEVTTLPYFSE